MSDEWRVVAASVTLAILCGLLGLAFGSSPDVRGGLWLVAGIAAIVGLARALVLLMRPNT